MIDISRKNENTISADTGWLLFKIFFSIILIGFSIFSLLVHPPLLIIPIVVLYNIFYRG